MPQGDPRLRGDDAGQKRGGDFPHQNNFQKNRAGLLTNWIFESIFSAQVCSLWYFFRLYARGVDDEERCCGQCGRGRDLFSNSPHCPIDNL